VTIPGKGGRPRKWRSNADRSRAYRARQRGEAEPAMVEHAVVDGDDLARARHEIERLAMTLANREAELRALRAEVERHRRANGALAQQLAFARRALDDLVDERARLLTERDELRAALNKMAPPERARYEPSPPGLPRHVRRQMEREARRQRGSN
jgi:chromosome segregation ATPase